MSHVTRIYETVLGRPLSGAQRENLERGLLGEALETLYRGFPDLSRVTPDLAPTCETVCDVLASLGDKPAIQAIARDLADEIAGLCTGSGPWSAFLNGTTNIDLTRGGRAWIQPRVFSFHELEGDPILQALAYTQVLSAIRRDSLIDEQPRIIAVDEVYRLMRHPSLLDFLIEAAKTFRTRRKKALMVDQQMSVFLEGKARLIFENCPIRVIFSQRQGMNVFHEDAAFAHFNQQHRDIIAQLPRFHFVLDIQDEGLWYLFGRATPGEFGGYNIWRATSPDLLYWGNHRLVLQGSPIGWDSGRFGGGAPPIWTEQGWLSIYHAADRQNRCCLGAFLAAHDNPARIIARNTTPIFAPELSYETGGFFPNVVFACGGVVQDDVLRLYFGASDESIGLAEISLPTLLRHLI